MKHTEENSMLVSELISQLTALKGQVGDVEVVIAKDFEAAYDVVGSVSAVEIAEPKATVIRLVRGNVVVKP